MIKPEENLFGLFLRGVEYATVNTDAASMIDRLEANLAIEGTLLIDELVFTIQWLWDDPQRTKNPLHVLCVLISEKTGNRLPIVQIGFERLSANHTRLALLWDNLGRSVLGNLIMAWLSPFEVLRIAEPAPDAPAPTPHAGGESADRAPGR